MIDTRDRNAFLGIEREMSRDYSWTPTGRHPLHMTMQIRNKGRRFPSRMIAGQARLASAALHIAHVPVTSRN